MSENKYDKLFTFSVVLLIVAMVMLCFTGYKVFSKKASPFAAKSKAIPAKDSLQNVYQSALKVLDNNLAFTGGRGADPASEEKLAQTNVLRAEIDSLLQRQGSDADLAIAKIKIAELQQNVAELQNRYSGVEAENRRLQGLINSLVKADRNASAPVAGERVSIPERENRMSSATSSNASAAPSLNTPGSSNLVSGMHLFAVAAVNSRDQETADADAAEKMVGSFSLKNLPARSNGEVVIVVLQPDGRVVKNSVWESGTFETREGKKIYSRKIFFDSAGEERQLNFSLTPDRFIKGDYTMQIWYNGNMVAKMVRTLS